MQRYCRKQSSPKIKKNQTNLHHTRGTRLKLVRGGERLGQGNTTTSHAGIAGRTVDDRVQFVGPEIQIKDLPCQQR